MTSGEPTLLEVEIWPTSITLAPGERLRLDLVVDDEDLGRFNTHNAAWGSALGSRGHDPHRR